MSIKKGKLKIIAVIILAILVIISGIIITKSVMTNNEIKTTEEKISKIDSTELENKLIEKFKTTSIFVSAMITYKESPRIVYTDLKKDENTNFVNAVIKCFANNDDEKELIVTIPCFKIESDNGKFKNINFFRGNNDIENIIEKAVIEVFKNEYNVDMFTNNSNYNNHFITSGKSVKKETNNEEFLQWVYEQILNEDTYPRKSMYASINWGIK